MQVNREKYRLYAVTDRRWAKDREDFFRQIEAVIDGGAGVVQFREKDLTPVQFLEDARRFADLCRSKGVLGMINDDPDTALAVQADGVHIGQSDMEACRARDLLGSGRIVGVSVHTVEQALRAQAAGADYLGVGAAFPTGTKDDAELVSRETIQAITDAVELPVVAIGGVGRENIRELKDCWLWQRNCNNRKKQHTTTKSRMQPQRIRIQPQKAVYNHKNIPQL